MSGLVQGYRAVTAADHRLRLVEPSLRSDFPTLADCLSGVLDEEGKYLALPACSLVIYAECGRTQVCVKPHSGGKVAFLDLTGADDWKGSLDVALGNGIAWREPNAKK